MSRTAARSGFQRLPKTCEGWVSLLPSRPIHGDVDLANAEEMIERLAGFGLNADQEDCLEALSTFAEAYEAARFHYGVKSSPGLSSARVAARRATVLSRSFRETISTGVCM